MNQPAFAPLLRRHSAKLICVPSGRDCGSVVRGLAFGTAIDEKSVGQAHQAFHMADYAHACTRLDDASKKKLSRMITRGIVKRTVEQFCTQDRDGKRTDSLRRSDVVTISALATATVCVLALVAVTVIRSTK